MSDEKKRHGLTREQWKELWDQGGWSDKIFRTCIEVAANKHAAPGDRALALDVWSDLILLGLAPASTPDDEHVPYPVVVRDVQLSVVEGSGTVDEVVRNACAERMTGVRWVIGYISNFFDPEALARARAQKLDASPLAAN